MDNRIKSWADRFNKINEGMILFCDGEDLGFCATSCDTCHSKLHGDRFKVMATERGQPIDSKFECSVCVDCINYIANGEVPNE